MQLNELINTYLSVKGAFVDSLNTQGLLQTEVNASIYTFLDKLRRGLEIQPQEFDEFSKKLNELDQSIKNTIISIVFSITHKIYHHHNNAIEKAVDNIETSVKTSAPIPQESPDAKKYIDLINIYHLFAHYLSIEKDGEHSNFFPGVNYYQRKILASNIPFAINALTLTGQLPKANYYGINTAHALYPLDLMVTQENKVLMRKGIKSSNEYFPYKSVCKIAKGDTGDNTFLATNGSKVLFMRGVERYSPEGILASKIATLVSAKHFSSERLMDNKIVASREINTYACSAADKKTTALRKKYIEEDKKVFPGTGIIDEVNNYVQETDFNIENLGFSTTDIEKAHLSKIDFDRCYTSPHISTTDYEIDLVSQCKFGIYRNLENIQKNEGYIREKLYARLKLSMITKPLLCGLADKAFMDKDQQRKEQSITECGNRSDIALELFGTHEKAKQFITNNSEILNQCYAEIALYIQDHFEQDLQRDLFESLEKRVKLIHSNLSKKLRITIPAPQIQSLKPESTPTEEKIEKGLSSTHYKYQVDSQKKSRFYHAFQVQGNQNLGEDLKNLKGDYLKSQILLQLKKEIECLDSKPKLEKYVLDLKDDPRFKILASGQGIVTKLGFFGLKTSSVKAFNKMIEEQLTIINSKNNPSSEI